MDMHPIAQRLAARLADGTDEPISQLIAEDLWLGIVDGTLGIGERLPTTRELAVALRVSPRAVERAYADLERRGVVARRPGEGAFVCLGEPAAELARRRELVALCRDTLARAGALGFNTAEVLEVIADLPGAGPPNPLTEAQS